MSAVLERPVGYSDNERKEVFKETATPVVGRILASIENKNYLNPAKTIAPQETQQLAKKIADKKDQGIDYCAVEELSMDSRASFWKKRTKDAPKTFEEKKQEWNESICNWIEANTEIDAQGRHEFIATLRAAGIELDKDDTKKDISDEVNKFYDKYLKEKNGVEKFVANIAKEKNGVTSPEQLERRLALMRGLLVSFGKEDSIPELVEDYARAHTLLSQKSKAGLAAIPFADTLTDSEKARLQLLHNKNQELALLAAEEEIEDEAKEEPKESMFDRLSSWNKERKAKAVQRRALQKTRRKEKVKKEVKPKVKVEKTPLTQKQKDMLSSIAAAAVAGTVLFGVGVHTFTNLEEQTDTVQVEQSAKLTKLVQKAKKEAAQAALEVRETTPKLGEIDDPKNLIGKGRSAVTTILPEGNIHATSFFGYSSEDQVEAGDKDETDNYIFAYEDQVRSKIMEEGLSKVDRKTKKVKKLDVEGKSGPELQKEIQYFSAGAGGQWEPGTLLLLTTKDGKQAVVIVADKGPAIWAQQKRQEPVFDMSWDTNKVLGNPEKVKAVPVPGWMKPWVKLGPVDLEELNARIAQKESEKEESQTKMSANLALLRAAQQEVKKHYIEGKNNYSIYGRWYQENVVNGRRNGEWYQKNHEGDYKHGNWCDMVIAKLAKDAGYEKEVGQFALTKDHVNWFKKMNAFNDTPAVGSLVFFDWGKGISHVGIVKSIDEKGRLHTIEGNTNKDEKGQDALEERIRNPENGKIAGYGHPYLVMKNQEGGENGNSDFKDELSSELKEKLQDYKNSAHVVDLKTGETIYSQGADRSVYPASTAKAIIAYEALALAQKGELDLDKKVSVQEQVGGTETPHKAGGPTRSGEELPIRSLIERAIVYSDNTASNQVLREVGTDRLQDLIKTDLKLQNTTIERLYFHDEGKKLETTPSDMVNFLSRVYKEAEAGNKASVQLLDYMKQGTAERFGERLDKQVQVMGKHGAKDTMQDQIAVVKDPNGKAFGIAVYADGVGEQEAEEFYANVINSLNTKKLG